MFYYLPRLFVCKLRYLHRWLLINIATTKQTSPFQRTPNNNKNNFTANPNTLSTQKKTQPVVFFTAIHFTAQSSRIRWQIVIPKNQTISTFIRSQITNVLNVSGTQIEAATKKNRDT